MIIKKKSRQVSPLKTINGFTTAVVISLLMVAMPSPAQTLELKGESRQGGLLVGKVLPGTQVELSGRSVRVSDEGTFVIGLNRDAPAEIELVTRSADGELETHKVAIAAREYNIQRVEGVPQRTVNPPEEALKRIREESAMVKKARQLDDNRLDFGRGFRWPIEGSITGVYGSQRFYNGEPKSPHYGIDIAAPKGAPVVAPAAGVVTLVHKDMYYSGGTLIIDHGHGVSSTFIHLSESLVAVGQRVEAGEVVAKVGSTGRSTGPHLDWRMNWFEVRIDPQLVIDAFPEK
ncbi:M23 family metallopeptidase [Porticoccaceae bacterium LTM1]|nr:M23 family metallopeptidase [Porticoccaceae bacterium LTM1]